MSAGDTINRREAEEIVYALCNVLELVGFTSERLIYDHVSRNPELERLLYGITASCKTAAARGFATVSEWDRRWTEEGGEI